MMSKKFLLLSVSLIFIFTGTVDSNSIEPDIFVQSTVNRASETLNNNFSKEEKIKKLKTIAKETVDIEELVFIHLVNNFNFWIGVFC